MVVPRAGGPSQSRSPGPLQRTGESRGPNCAVMQDAGICGRERSLTRQSRRSRASRRVASRGGRLGTRLRWAQGRGDLRVAPVPSFMGRARRAQWGSAGPLASTSWIAARGARRKRPALVVKGFLSKAIRQRLLAAGSPLGRAEVGPRPWGLGLLAGGAGVWVGADCAGGACGGNLH